MNEKSFNFEIFQKMQWINEWKCGTDYERETQKQRVMVLDSDPK